MCPPKHVVFEKDSESESKQVHNISESVMRKEPEMFHFKIKKSLRMGINVVFQRDPQEKVCF